jgi:hypothetical protein
MMVASHFTMMRLFKTQLVDTLYRPRQKLDAIALLFRQRLYSIPVVLSTKEELPFCLFPFFRAEYIFSRKSNNLAYLDQIGTTTLPERYHDILSIC